MSVFTFEPDPPRVSSPWLRPADPRTRPAPTEPPCTALEHYGVSKLEAEPQDGPTEYKLHLLLRSRRTYLRMSTTTSKFASAPSRAPLPPCDAQPARSSPSGAIAQAWPAQTRQDRLEHLTTQLMWRLQQSSPYHSGSLAPELVVPKLPDANAQLSEPARLANVQPGLEESRGALYEIGVADDGTFVGLTQDEMDESLATLRTMAASLGCNVKELRRVMVGDCEWKEPAVEASSPDEGRFKAALWVAEALVMPDLRPRDAAQEPDPPAARVSSLTAGAPLDPQQGPLSANQLRVSLTGPTTYGKSTLLGTLTSGALDNGKGKSRLNLLKHRHEVESGVTSSVAQELLGYDPSGGIVNYALGGVESWIDIHNFTRSGRLVFLVDSAGHLRFRRSIIRGIVGRAPHWTLLCISAEGDLGDVGGPALPHGIPGTSIDLAATHLDFCLRLKIPLVVIVTKIDLANKTSISSTLGRVLSAVKKTGRVPKILQPVQSNGTQLGQVSPRDHDAVASVTTALSATGDLLSLVPVVPISAVSGRGIGLLHALLRALPLPAAPTSLDYVGAALNPEQPSCLFHIEETFNLPAFRTLATSNQDQQTEVGTVVAGYLRFGSLSVGDEVVVGPFPGGDDDMYPYQTPDHRPSPGDFGLAAPDPSSAELNCVVARNAASASAIKGEWCKAIIVSIRNLRLPVQTLMAGQVGSIGLVLAAPERQDDEDDLLQSPPPAESLLRKGMVLAVPSQHMATTGLSLQAASGLTAAFKGSEATSLTLGSLVSVYVASVHATARVLCVSRPRAYADGTTRGQTAMGEDAEGEMFRLRVNEEAGGVQACASTELQLELLHNREWIELGSRILILEGRGKDMSGLKGLVGRVIEIVE